MSDRRRDQGTPGPGPGVDLDDEGFSSAEIPLIPFYWAGDQSPGKRAERHHGHGRARGVVKPWMSAADRKTDEWTREGWTHRALTPGETLWAQGDSAHELAWIAAGEIAVVIDERPVARLGAGHLVGEASVFVENEHRLGSIVGVKDAELWTIDRDRLLGLKTTAPRTYDALVEAALLAMAERVEAADAQLVERTQGQLPAPRRGLGTALGRLWKRLTGSQRPTMPPGIDRSLRELPGLFDADDAIIKALAGIVRARYVEDDHALFLEGDPGASLYVVAQGALAVLRDAGDGRAYELTTVGPGTLLGTGVLIRGGIRGASAVARGGTWVFEVTQPAVEKLPRPARRALFESLLVTMRSQLAIVDALLTKAPKSEDALALEEVLEALGALQARHA
ncbi:MAG: cyclic nucleotide-binding domain-containing protein [bacterium]